MIPWRKCTLFILVLLVPAMFYMMFPSRPIQNFADQDGPFFEGHYGPQEPEAGTSLKVVCWNMDFAEEVEEAVRALSQDPPLKDADILLLQEMDEKSVDSIAQTLGYNYVYYPASIHRNHNKNFGNAILSRWPLQKPAKIVLPTAGPGKKHTRIAVKAETQTHNRNIVLYSVHLETFWIWQSKDIRQAAFLSQQINDESAVVIGGDFNSLTRGSILYLEEAFGQLEFARVSAGTGHTFLLGPLKLTLDHIFSKGLLPLEAGVWRESAASDHYPLWAVFETES